MIRFIRIIPAILSFHGPIFAMAGVMSNESDLTASLLEGFRRSLDLREKYMKWSLQSPWDDPKNSIMDHDVQLTR